MSIGYDARYIIMLRPAQPSSGRLQCVFLRFTMCREVLGMAVDYDAGKHIFLSAGYNS